MFGSELFKFLFIPILVLLSHYTSLLTYTLVRNIKTGQYITPVFGWQFENNGWPSFFYFMGVSLGIMQVFYWVGGMLLFTAYKLAMDHYEEMYPVVILNLATMTFTTVIMMYFRVKEIPGRDGWIALILIFIASFLAIHAGKSISPR